MELFTDSVVYKKNNDILLCYGRYRRYMGSESLGSTFWVSGCNWYPGPRETVILFKDLQHTCWVIIKFAQEQSRRGTGQLISQKCVITSVYIYYIVDMVGCVVISNTLLRAGCYFDQIYGAIVAVMLSVR